MDMTLFLYLFYDDDSGYIREKNTTDQLQMEMLRDGNAFYVNGEKHYANGESSYDESTKEAYVIDENGKRWNESEFPYSNIIGKVVNA